jgi:hypothetical protein
MIVPFGTNGMSIEPLGFLSRKVRQGLFAVSTLTAERIQTSTRCQTHQPMLEGCLSPPGIQSGEGLHQHILNQIGDIVFPTQITTNQGEESGLMAPNQHTELLGVARTHRAHNFRIRDRF